MTNPDLADLLDQHARMAAENRAWLEMRLPFYFHSCRRHVHKRGKLDGRLISRCPCGGISIGENIWLEKNSARRFHRAERRRLRSQR